VYNDIITNHEDPNDRMININKEESVNIDQDVIIN